MTRKQQGTYLYSLLLVLAKECVGEISPSDIGLEKGGRACGVRFGDHCLLQVCTFQGCHFQVNLAFSNDTE